MISFLPVSHRPDCSCFACEGNRTLAQMQCRTDHRFIARAARSALSAQNLTHGPRKVGIIRNALVFPCESPPYRCIYSPEYFARHSEHITLQAEGPC